VAQDSNASRLGVQSCSSRIVAKGGALYTNASWDLVDKTLELDFDWDAMPIADLPQALQEMTADQRVGFVEAKRTEREAIQEQIQQISEAREEFVREALRERIGEHASGVGEAMRRTIREQALAKGFECLGC
jgi:hypothetical protein